MPNTMSKPQQTFPCQLRRLKYDDFPNSHMREDILNALALRCVDIVKQLDRTPVRGLLFNIKRLTLQEGVHCDGMVVPVKVSMVSEACDVEIRSLRVFVLDYNMRKSDTSPTYPGQRALCLYAALCKLINLTFKHINNARSLTAMASAGMLRQGCAAAGVAQGADGPPARSGTFHRHGGRGWACCLLRGGWLAISSAE